MLANSPSIWDLWSPGNAHQLVCWHCQGQASLYSAAASIKNSLFTSATLVSLKQALLCSLCLGCPVFFPTISFPTKPAELSENWQGPSWTSVQIQTNKPWSLSKGVGSVIFLGKFHVSDCSLEQRSHYCTVPVWPDARGIFCCFFYLNAKLVVESWWWSRQEQRLLLSPLEEPWAMAAAGTAAVNCIARRQLFSWSDSSDAKVISVVHQEREQGSHKHDKYADCWSPGTSPTYSLSPALVCCSRVRPSPESFKDLSFVSGSQHTNREILSERPVKAPSEVLPQGSTGRLSLLQVCLALSSSSIWPFGSTAPGADRDIGRFWHWRTEKRNRNV